jgi:hypothetical protein
MEGGVEPGVSEILGPQNRRRDDDGVVRDVQKLANHLHGANRVLYQFFITDHGYPGIPLVLGNDLMG